MIRKIFMLVNADRNVFPREMKIANQYEIQSNELIFSFNFRIPENAFVYIILINNTDQYYLPLVDNKFVIDSNETWISGGWNAHIMISEAEIVDGVVDKSKALFISDSFGLIVEDNDINIDDLKNQEMPQQLKLLYDDLMSLKAELERLLQTGGGGNSSGTISNVIDLIDRDTKEIYRIEVKSGDLIMSPIATSPIPNEQIKLYDSAQDKYYLLSVKSGHLIMEGVV